MPELILHFEAAAGTDLEGAAAELRKSLGVVDGIESAASTPQRFQAIGPSEIVSVIQVATTIAQSGAAFLAAVAALYAAWEKVKPMFPGLRSPTVEIGLKKIPLEQIGAEHRAEAIGS
jgi:hypothetical protein